MVIELAWHANDCCLIIPDVLPSMIDAGWNKHEALISLPEKELIDATECRRLAPTIVTNDAKGTGRRE
jgi:hypothetical protein